GRNRVEPVQKPIGINSFEANRQKIRQRRHELLFLPLPAQLQKLLPLSRHAGNHKAALMQHADQPAELLERDLLRRKLLLKAIAQIIEAALAVEPVEEIEFFFLEAKVVQSDRVLDNPVLPTLIALLGNLQVGPPAYCQWPCGTGNQAVG